MTYEDQTAHHLCASMTRAPTSEHDPRDPASPYHDGRFDPDHMRVEARSRMVDRILAEVGLSHDPKIVRAVALAYGSGLEGITANDPRPLRIWY